jgi:DNA-binding transcriptional MocR family regulator
VSHILQQLVVSLWSDPASGRRLARAADVYTLRRKALVSALETHGIPATAPSGFNVWLPVRDEAFAVQALAQRGWAVAPGARFRIRSPRAIRITTSALPVEDAPRLAADVADALRPSALSAV